MGLVGYGVFDCPTVHSKVVDGPKRGDAGAAKKKPRGRQLGSGSRWARDTVMGLRTRIVMERALRAKALNPCGVVTGFMLFYREFSDRNRRGATRVPLRHVYADRFRVSPTIAVRTSALERMALVEVAL